MNDNNTPDDISPKPEPIEVWDVPSPTSPSAFPIDDLFRTERALRPTLTEPAFRRYEVYIAIASHGSYAIDPRKEPVGHMGKGVSCHTFAIGIRDAIIGYGKYSYQSTKISPTFDYTSIKIEELANGHVRIINKNMNATLSGDDVLMIKQTINS